MLFFAVLLIAFIVGTWRTHLRNTAWTTAVFGQEVRLSRPTVVSPSDDWFGAISIRLYSLQDEDAEKFRSVDRFYEWPRRENATGIADSWTRFPGGGQTIKGSHSDPDIIQGWRSTPVSLMFFLREGRKDRDPNVARIYQMVEALSQREDGWYATRGSGIDIIMYILNPQTKQFAIVSFID